MGQIGAFRLRQAAWFTADGACLLKEICRASAVGSQGRTAARSAVAISTRGCRCVEVSLHQLADSALPVRVASWADEDAWTAGSPRRSPMSGPPPASCGPKPSPRIRSGSRTYPPDPRVSLTCPHPDVNESAADTACLLSARRCPVPVGGSAPPLCCTTWAISCASRRSVHCSRRTHPVRGGRPTRRSRRGRRAVG
jgi:hypothetical protein